MMRGLVHKAGRDFLEVVKEICGIVAGPVSAEVVALEHDEMMREAAEAAHRVAGVVIGQKGALVDPKLLA